MNTPYIPHLFGEAAEQKLRSRLGWLTAGVTSSISWPLVDVWILYDGHEYVLRGAADRQPPGISTPCPRDGDAINVATQRLYTLASILGWFKRGYVDVQGTVWGTAAIRYGSRETYSSTFDGTRYFSCNYMPVIDDELIRRALAFMREGRRLRYIHEPYAFLSFFKVLESQFASRDRVNWVEQNLPHLEGSAAERVNSLQAEGVNVSRHLYESGRCAIAHASLNGVIVDPDVPSDRHRIRDDLDVMAALAERYLRVDARVPDEMSLFCSRDRVSPWYALLPPETVARLHAGEVVDAVDDYAQFLQNVISVRLWPHDAAEPMSNMSLDIEGVGEGLIQLKVVNERQTIFLRFQIDFNNRRLHALPDQTILTNQFNSLTEEEVEHCTRYVHSVIGNDLVELCVNGLDPVQCEIIIPTNILPQDPELMVRQALENFRSTAGYTSPHESR